MTKRFHHCEIRELAVERRQEAALAAVEINPANAPMRQVLAATMTAFSLPSTDEIIGDLISDPQFLAVLTQKYWGSAGKDFSVSFLDNPTSAFKSKCLAHANVWGKYCNVTFRETSSKTGDIRLLRTRGGYWSYLGTDIRLVSPNEQTMNLEGFNENTSDSEFMRVVPHEFGHSMGFPHEHMREQIIRKLNRAKTIAWFRQKYGWSESMVVSNVLTPLSEASIMGTPNADEASIMTYQLPGAITNDGKPIIGGSTLSEADIAFSIKLYPKETAPPPPQGGKRRVILDFPNEVQLPNVSLE